ncbi:DUF192 domain-containing protein [Candidatus Shapirobacteria bacterium]|nr:DUF192 domain-containing protein [Candidatus Shapirobacteria bacterium]
MSKNIFLISLIIIGCTIVYLVFFDRRPSNILKLKLGNKLFNLETATTIPQQTIGLMNRTSLPENSGMIFIFNINFTQTFWMKNTLIPLDIIFVTSEGIVTNIEHALPEAKDDQGNFITYKSTTPARYVIEINAGLSDEIGLKPGDKIDLSTLKL